MKSVFQFLQLYLITFAIILHQLNSQDNTETTDIIDTLKLEEESIRSDLLHATVENDVLGIKTALEKGENIDVSNVNGWTAPMFAVAEGHVSSLRYLVEQGADLNLQNKEGSTSLMMAAEEGDKEMIEILLEGNADPTIIRSSDNHTAYTIALQTKRMVNAAILLEGAVIHGMAMDDPILILKSIQDGAYVNLRTSGGWNPLIYASMRGHTQLVEELIKLGANLHHVENDGWSPLHFAVMEGHDSVVSVLLQAGCPIHIKNHQDKTALMMAKELNMTTIITLIEQYVTKDDQGNIISEL